MAGLERLRLTSKRSEASSLLAVESSVGLASLDSDAAWWTCHDEGDLDAMVSIVVTNGDEWNVQPVRLVTGEDERTDAEALARSGDTVFVFGSNFTGKSGRLDGRRAFVARFSETAAIAGSDAVEVLDLGTAIVDIVSAAMSGVDLLASDEGQQPVNVEGAGIVGADLWLGLRWPVSAGGQPVLVRLAGGAMALTAADWSVETLGGLETSVVVVDVGASAKRPAGVRGMTVADGVLHLVVGQTDRDLAAKKVKAAAAKHVSLAIPDPAQFAEGVDAVEAIEIEQFEGFRKVEGVAPAPGGGWLYALDDEDAVVLIYSPG